ncbi:MAG: alanine racemase [Ignavibacteriales bacterium]|nr:alanine racemase [Ignavibacteriales bacterium]
MKNYSGLIIDINCILENYRAIKNQVGASAIIAVVKADAYGHGMEAVVTALEKEKEKPLMYAVAKLSEALSLRECFPDIRILLFEPLSLVNVEAISKAGIVGTIATEESNDIMDLAACIHENIQVHVKVNTGMNRLGVQWNSSVALFNQLKQYPDLIVDGIYTHLADSDNSDATYTEMQIDRFNMCLNDLKDAGITPGLIHAANSGGIWFHPRAHYQAVRPGISLYGYYPSHLKSAVDLKPGMELHSFIESIRTVEPDESVSYAKLYMSTCKMRVATIPLGYADGIPRNLSNKLQVIVGDKLFSQIGRVTMDRIIIEIGEEPVKIGDEVILLGRTGDLTVDAWDWSDNLQTIPYEITCSLNSKRMAKFYKI